MEPAIPPIYTVLGVPLAITLPTLHELSIFALPPPTIPPIYSYVPLGYTHVPLTAPELISFSKVPPSADIPPA